MSALLLIVSSYPIATGFTTNPSPVPVSSDDDYILILWPQRSMNWISAQDYCQLTYNSDLATIITHYQYQLISNYSTSSAMVGLQYTPSNDIWSWINGPTTADIQLSIPHPQFYCSQLIVSDTAQYLIEAIDCNTAYPQFYCNKVRSYIYIEQRKTFMDAEQHCKKQYGTHLATITRSKDLRNAQQLLSNSNVWIGLYHDLWLDDTLYLEHNMNILMASNYNGDSNCNTLSVHSGYIGNDNECHDTLPFLCNKRAKTREYIVHKQRKKYIEAQQFCVETYGTDLATIITEEEFSDAMRIIPQSKGAWIGLKKQYRDNVYNWSWIDGTLCTEDKLCVPYWLRSEIVIEPVYDCGLLQNGRARTALCAQQMDYFLCNKPQSYFEESGIVPNVVSKRKDVNVKMSAHGVIAHKEASNHDLLHHGRTLYYLHPEQAYDATYRMPAQWIVIAGYIGIGVLLVSILLYCVTYCLLLTEPSPVKELERRNNV